MDAITVLVVEHNSSLSVLLEQLLRSEPDIDLVGQASEVAHALALLADKPPAVVVMDVLLPNIGVLEAILLFRAKSPHSKIILLADREESRYHETAVRYGAAACLRKDRIATDLVPLMKQVAQQAPVIKLLSSVTNPATSERTLGTTDKPQKPENPLAAKEIIPSNVPT